MWLILNTAYPKGTEILLTIELDEQHNSIKMSAILKNDPSVRENCSFSRGGIDEKISLEVETIIQELNEEWSLTHHGTVEANRLAGDIIKSVNQIKDGQLDKHKDRLEVAQSKLQELKMFASRDMNWANFYLGDLRLVIEYFINFLHELQVDRIREIIEKLEHVLASQNLSIIDSYVAEARQERDNLPDLVKTVLYCRDGILKAELVSPTHARTMKNKFDRLLTAMKYNDLPEVERLINDLLPDVNNYFDQMTPTSSINTSLTR
jgi:molecular chaperone DnaK